MKGGRKNLKRAVNDKTTTLEQGQMIMQVVNLRGSNQIEVMDAKGEKFLAIFPAKFQKSMWIKRGNFVVVDESAKDKAIESGMKVGCTVTQVLFYDQVREYQKSSDWPDVFKSAAIESSTQSLERHTSQPRGDDVDEDDEDDGLPPLEANTNRLKPFQSAESDAEQDSEPDS